MEKHSAKPVDTVQYVSVKDQIPNHPKLNET
jgi:hypothetical protein